MRRQGFGKRDARHIGNSEEERPVEFLLPAIFCLFLGVAVIFLSLGTRGQSAFAATPFCYTFSANLGIQATGPDVTALQTALARSGIALSSSDGITTADLAGHLQQATIILIKKFQLKYGIAPTGFVGPVTRAKLNLLYSCSSVGSSVVTNTSTKTVQSSKPTTVQTSVQTPILDGDVVTASPTIAPVPTQLSTSGGTVADFIANDRSTVPAYSKTPCLTVVPAQTESTGFYLQGSSNSAGDYTVVKNQSIPSLLQTISLWANPIQDSSGGVNSGCKTAVVTPLSVWFVTPSGKPGIPNSVTTNIAPNGFFHSQPPTADERQTYALLELTTWFSNCTSNPAAYPNFTFPACVSGVPVGFSANISDVFTSLTDPRMSLVPPAVIPNGEKCSQPFNSSGIAISEPTSYYYTCFYNAAPQDISYANGYNQITINPPYVFASVGDEDAVISQIQSTGYATIGVGSTADPALFPNQYFNVPMTNCQLVQGDPNAPHQMVYMRDNVGHTTSLATIFANWVYLQDQEGFNAIDPFKTYINRFAFYLDLNKVDASKLPTQPVSGLNGSSGFSIYTSDANQILQSASSCGPNAYEYIYFLGDPTIYAGFSNSFLPHTVFARFDLDKNLGAASVPGTVLHETAHAIAGLKDEYIAAAASAANYSFDKNCSTNPSVDWRNPADNLVYGGMDSKGNLLYSGCHSKTDSNGKTVYRPSQTSIMNDEAQNPKFNVVSCGYLVDAILKGNNPSSIVGAPHWPAIDQSGDPNVPKDSHGNPVGCMSMDTVKDGIPSLNPTPTVTASNGGSGLLFPQNSVFASLASVIQSFSGTSDVVGAFFSWWKNSIK